MFLREYRRCAGGKWRSYGAGVRRARARDAIIPFKEQIVEFPADPVEHFVRQAVAEKREVDIRAVPDGRNRRVVSVTSFRSFFRREL